MDKNKQLGPFDAWVQGYEGELGEKIIVLRVQHEGEEVPAVERIPVSECGKLAISASVEVDEEVEPDGTVHPHIHQNG